LPVQAVTDACLQIDHIMPIDSVEKALLHQEFDMSHALRLHISLSWGWVHVGEFKGTLMCKRFADTLFFVVLIAKSR